MRRRYVLAPEAALDLVRIWRYVKDNASLEMADRVESAICEKIVISFRKACASRALATRT